ncbi:MAG: VacB/RNase II family 3'-5' exoribonuclease [Euryarchaeota archaeon]|nr:VacB/RNase II family 3'-5' exoribonuclease [Euryarchaeota archaeon]
MKPGDVVELKAGTHGIKAPENYGIYLDRVKRKSDFFILLYTVKGRIEVKREHVGKVVMRTPLPEKVTDEDLRKRLPALLKDASTASKSASSLKLTDGELEESRLWNTVVDKLEAGSPEEIAEAAFGPVGRQQTPLEAVKNMLESCRQPGIGHFERVATAENKWRPITRDEANRFHEHKRRLQALKNVLVKTEDVEEEGRVRTVYKGVPVAEAKLTETQHEDLAFVGKAMESFILNDRFTGEIGLGGTRLHTLAGFSLFDLLKWLALDWTGARRITTSSAMVELLVGAGLRSVEETMALVAKRKVLLAGDFEWEMDPRVSKAAEGLARLVTDDEIKRRRDFRALETYTIDPADAKDFDDAISFVPHADGGATIHIHIADVSFFVHKGTLIDRSAERKATSLYLPTGVLPMLPARLSEDLCSLRAGTPKMALTASLTFDNDANLVGEAFSESVIAVTKNLHYGFVDEAVAVGREPFASMEAFGRRIRSKGSGLALDTGERKISFVGDEVRNHIKRATPATQMIETFMVAANEAVARRLDAERVPAMFRCHPLPEAEQARRFNGQTKAMGVSIEIVLPKRPGEDEKQAASGEDALLERLLSGGKLALGASGTTQDDLKPEDPPTAAARPILHALSSLGPEERAAWLGPFRAALETVEGVRDVALKELVYLKLLGCMGRAFYTPDNIGHFGLGSGLYCHFTSPIRRYPDLVVHRQLRWLLQGRPGGSPPHDHDEIAMQSAQCTKQGAAADGLERSVVDSALTFKAREVAAGTTVEAVVNGVTKGGVFLSLPDGVEARISASDIPGGPWSVDEFDAVLFTGSIERLELVAEVSAKNWRELVDEKTGEAIRVRLRLGDKVKVVLAERDYVEGRIAAKLAA